MDEKYRQLQRLAKNGDKEIQMLLDQESLRAGRTPSLDYILGQWEEIANLVKNNGLKALENAFTKLCQNHPTIEEIRWAFDNIDTDVTEWDCNGFQLLLKNLDMLSTKDFSQLDCLETFTAIKNFRENQITTTDLPWLDPESPDAFSTEDLEELYLTLEDFLKITQNISDEFVQMIRPSGHFDFAFTPAKGLVSK